MWRIRSGGARERGSEGVGENELPITKRHGCGAGRRPAVAGVVALRSVHAALAGKAEAPARLA